MNIVKKLKLNHELQFTYWFPYEVTNNEIEYFLRMNSSLDAYSYVLQQL